MRSCSDTCQLNQTQFQALQTIQDQQSQILSALLPVLPLLQSVPLHIENARNQVKDSLSELQRQVSVRDARPVPAVLVSNRTPQPAERAPSYSAELVNAATSPVERKKRRLDEVSDSSSDPISEFADARISALAPATAPSPEVPLSSLRSHLSRKNTVRSPLTDLFPTNTNHRSAAPVDVKGARLSSQVHAAVTPVSSTIAPFPGFSGALCTPTRGRTHSARPHNPGPTFNVPTPPGPPGGSKSLLPSVKRTPQSRRASRQSAHAPQVPQAVAHGTPVLPVLNRSFTTQPSPDNRNSLHRTTTARQDTTKGNALDLVARFDMRPPSVPPSAGKPMSLKDRRALLFLSEDVAVSHLRRHLLGCMLTSVQRNEGKRFIPLDDEDDEDIELVE